MKLDLLTNATVVDDAIRFVSTRSKENLKSSCEDDKEESNEPDYDEDQDQLEEQQEEEIAPLRNRTVSLKTSPCPLLRLPKHMYV
jgi:hypothetical protein